MTIAISAAVRVDCINCRTALQQRDGLCGAAVVAQVAELGVGVVHITGAIEVARIVAAQVVTRGDRGARAVSSSVIRENAVLEGRRRTVKRNDATTIRGDGAV